VSALAHYIEDEGVATTGISLVRDNSERLRPPRFLWVPFELGRPFGAPNDASLQTKVLRAALALLERDDGSPILDDYPDEAPYGRSSSDDNRDGHDNSDSDDASSTGWSCPIAFPHAQTADEPNALAEVLAEIATLAPWQTLARETRGRSAVGAARMEIEQSVRFLYSLLEGQGCAPNPSSSLSLAQLFRGAAEDLKAFYMEAATARPARVSSADLADWFWGDTCAGALLLALHPATVISPDAGVRQVAEGQLVPRDQSHRLVTAP
jgi:hypothetical protein